MAAKQGWILFHLDLKTILQGQSYTFSRVVACQLPPETGHPQYITARLKKPAYGMLDAPRRWWCILDKALCSYGTVPTRADRCCYVLYSMDWRERAWNQGDHSQRTNTKENISIKQRERIEADDACTKSWIPMQAAQPQEKP